MTAQDAAGLGLRPCPAIWLRVMNVEPAPKSVNCWNSASRFQRPSSRSPPILKAF